MALADALATYDRVALNLDKLDRVWQQIAELIPEGPFLTDGGSDDEIRYDALAESWAAIAKSLPAINGWRIMAEIIDFAAIGQARLDCLDIDEPAVLRQFDATVYAPGTEAKIYRHKLVRARQDLVRQRAQQLLVIVDEALATVPTTPGEDLTAVDATAVLDRVREAFNELERLLGRVSLGRW